MLADLVVIHLKGEPCCCDKCDRNYFAADCGPGLVEKEIIDRLGRKSKRCVRQDEGIGGEESSGGNKAAIDKFNIDVEKDKHDVADDFALEVFGEETDVAGLEGGLRTFFDGKKQEMGIESSSELNNAFNSESQNASWVWSSVASPGGQDLQKAAATMKEGNADRYDELMASLQVREVGSGFNDEIMANFQDSVAKEQAFWNEKLGDNGTVTVYRGMSVEGLEVGSNVVSDSPLSSYSMYPSIANRFGNVVISRQVKADEIFGSPFSTLTSGRALGEFVVYTPPDGADVEVLTTTARGDRSQKSFLPPSGDQSGSKSDKLPKAKAAEALSALEANDKETYDKVGGDDHLNGLATADPSQETLFGYKDALLNMRDNDSDTFEDIDGDSLITEIDRVLKTKK